MFERQMILTRGFNNVKTGGQTIGFQFLLKTAYYRGTFLSLLGSIDVSVDGRGFSSDAIRITLNSNVFSLAEAAKAEGIHWDFGAPMSVLVLTQGGLQAGTHSLKVTLGINPSYVPVGLFRATGEKRVTLVI